MAVKVAPRLWYPNCRAVLQVLFDGFGSHDDDEEPLVIRVLPKTATIHKNSYRQADSWELTFDAGDLPFDPRFVRGGFAEIYLFQTESFDDTRRVLSRRDPLAEPDPGALRPRDPTDTLALELDAVAARKRFTGSSPQVAGLFDRQSLDLSGDGKWVSISGQDLTAHLAAKQWPPNPNGSARRIPIGKRVDLLLADILEEADPTGHMQLVVRGIDDITKLPIVGEGNVRGARGITVEQKTSYWEVMYGIAIRAGLIAYVEGVDVILGRPKTLETATKVRRLTWGRDLEHLSIERSLGRAQVPTIIAQGYDAVTRKQITIEYPPGQIDRSREKPVLFSKIHGTRERVTTTEKHAAKVASKKKGKVATVLGRRDEYEFITLYGTTDRDSIQRAAENAYHLKGPSERRCVATTRDLRDRDRNDMLDLSSGDAVSIEWDEFKRELLQSDKLSEAEKVEHLVLQGYNREVARFVARKFEQVIALDHPLRVKEVTYSFDVDGGIGIELELYDFIMTDGIRPGDGAPAPTRTGGRDLRTTSGDRIGWSPEKRASEKAKHRL